MLTKTQIDALINIISTFTAVTVEIPNISSAAVIVFSSHHPRHPFFLYAEHEPSSIGHECSQCRLPIYTRDGTLRANASIFPARQFLMVMLGLLAPSRAAIEGYAAGDRSISTYSDIITFLNKNRNHTKDAIALVESIKRMETRTEPSFPPLATYLDNIVRNTDSSTFSIPPFEAFLEDLERQATAAAIAAPRSLVGDGYRRREDVALALALAQAFEEALALAQAFEEAHAIEESRVTYSREAADRSSLEEAELAAAVEQSRSTFEEEDRARRAAAAEAPGSHPETPLPAECRPSPAASAVDATTAPLPTGYGPSEATAAAATAKAEIVQSIADEENQKSVARLAAAIAPLDKDTLVNILRSRFGMWPIADASIMNVLTISSRPITVKQHSVVIQKLYALDVRPAEITALLAPPDEYVRPVVLPHRTPTPPADAAAAIYMADRMTADVMHLLMDAGNDACHTRRLFALSAGFPISRTIEIFKSSYTPDGQPLITSFTLSSKSTQRFRAILQILNNREAKREVLDLFDYKSGSHPSLREALSRHETKSNPEKSWESMAKCYFPAAYPGYEAPPQHRTPAEATYVAKRAAEWERSGLSAAAATVPTSSAFPATTPDPSVVSCVRIPYKDMTVDQLKKAFGDTWLRWLNRRRELGNTTATAAVVAVRELESQLGILSYWFEALAAFNLKTPLSDSRKSALANDLVSIDAIIAKSYKAGPSADASADLVRALMNEGDDKWHVDMLYYSARGLPTCEIIRILQSPYGSEGQSLIVSFILSSKSTHRFYAMLQILKESEVKQEVLDLFNYKSGSHPSLREALSRHETKSNPEKSWESMAKYYFPFVYQDTATAPAATPAAAPPPAEHRPSAAALAPPPAETAAAVAIPALPVCGDIIKIFIPTTAKITHDGGLQGRVIPPPDSSYVVTDDVTGVICAQYSVMGGRSTHEDAEFYSFFKVGDVRYTFSGVCDGHGGDLVARYVVENLPQTLKSCIGRGIPPQLALAEAFQLVQRNLEVADADGTEDRRYEQRFANNTGATTTAVLIVTNTDGSKNYFTANLGDSRTVICVDNDAYATIDHKPTDPAEQKMIKEAGKIFFHGRIDARLAVSRGFGNHDFRLFGPLRTFGPFKKEEIATGFPAYGRFHIPTVEQLDLAGKRASFIIQACDGLWDEVSSEDAVRTVKLGLSEGIHPQVIQAYLIKLVEDSLVKKGRRGSGDNVSVLLLINSEKYPYTRGLLPLNNKEIATALTSAAASVFTGKIPYEEIIMHDIVDSSIPVVGVPAAAADAVAALPLTTPPTLLRAAAAAAWAPPPPPPGPSAAAAAAAAEAVAEANTVRLRFLLLGPSKLVDDDNPSSLTETMKALGKDALLRVLKSPYEPPRINIPVVTFFALSQPSSYRKYHAILEFLKKNSTPAEIFDLFTYKIGGCYSLRAVIQDSEEMRKESVRYFPYIYAETCPLPETTLHAEHKPPAVDRTAPRPG
jgi:serine/threonine protein phosphatase PrpC